MQLFGNTINTLKSLTIFLKHLILDVCLDSERASQIYASRVLLNNRSVSLVATHNNTQRRMSCETFSTVQALSNSVFSTIFVADKYLLKLTSNSIRTWFQIFSKLTERHLNCFYLYQSKALLLFLIMLYNLFQCLPC